MDIKYREDLVRQEDRLMAEERRANLQKLNARRAVEEVNQQMLGQYGGGPGSPAGSVGSLGSQQQSSLNIGYGREDELKLTRLQNAKVLGQQLDEQLQVGGC